MFNCKKHGLTYIGKICKKCERENKRIRVESPSSWSRAQQNQHIQEQVSGVDVEDVLLTAALLNSLQTNCTPNFELPKEEIPLFEQGESGGGGASRGFEVDSEPESQSNDSND
jgi:hypothetical protein